MECAMPRAISTIPRDGLRLGDAMRKFGPPEIVAKLDALLEEREVAQNWAALTSLVSPRATLEREVEAVLASLWANLKSRLVADDLILSWQPSDPTAERRPLAADRCARLEAWISIDGIESRVFFGGHVLDDVLIHPEQTEPPPATAEIGGTGEVATDVSTPPTPADPEFVDLRSEPAGRDPLSAD
jgi:hypothetical protein